jgi:predicted nucleotide-binding protein
MDPSHGQGQLEALAEKLDQAAAAIRDPQVEDPLNAMRSAVEEVGLAWSESPIGYHARIYYEGLSAPPHGAMFDRDWGWLPAFSNRTRGDWEVFGESDVITEIERRAGHLNLSAVEATSDEASRLVEDCKWEASSIVSALLDRRTDEHMLRLLEEIQSVSVTAQADHELRMLPRGPLISRDTTAIAGGPQLAPHQKVAARLMALRDPFEKVGALATILHRAARHAGRLPAPAVDEDEGRTVFIGHGGSGVWRDLKEFLADRLGLEVDEFNRVSTAGIGTTERLQEMLGSAAMAFLVLTAEDEEADGRTHARLNVVHEVGLFQARLGVHRAIVLLEEGCEEFSNIEGLGQIRFPAGNIAGKFEEVRRVLEREGIITASRLFDSEA